MPRKAHPYRTDSVSRVILAPPERIYRALLDPVAVASWLPPKGMDARIVAFEPWEGGAYAVTLSYRDARGSGKTSADEDVVRGRFVRLVADEEVVQVMRFESDDPAFAGEMTITWALEALGALEALETVQAGTKVTATCANVPAGISKADHETGLRSTLDNLASFTE
ncbi:SRPBCC domain-containing protein [Rhizobium sp. TRM96647]|uniref:SRPBCC domain-containing protein n=1 Tax=unclassified Rhizobium TaxID=2613769 RepID=UPI0021E8199D|nr:MULTISPECIES: SRPBCC domain-containing protein [unclassified Rhizobium]MCV3736560.1 SRPBCC domain-containing protein [Rhizobium sp. TRM96647]MCV3758929.1 SRPBCC domain-containing protein [Rhizobium sp. TRM96650]